MKKYKKVRETLRVTRRMLLGAGPSEVSDRVLRALSQPVIGHLDPEFLKLMDIVSQQLRDAFITKNKLTIPMSAPGSVGMETCFVNLVEPGDQVLICINGVFGGRMLENAQRLGARPVVLEQPWGEAVCPDQVRDALKKNPEINLVAFVHAETSTGVLSDAQTITQIAHEHDALVIVDCVTSLGGVPVRVDDWGMDAVYSGTQKCLSCVPGLSPLTFNERAVERLKNRKTKVPSWFMDLNLVMQYWDDEGGGRTYHHTAPVNSIYALNEALNQLLLDGLERVWWKHRIHHEALCAGIDAMGFEYMVKNPSDRLPQINAVVPPAGIGEAEARKLLLEQLSLEIGVGLGPWANKVWRIGLMGINSSSRCVLTFLAAYNKLLDEHHNRALSDSAVNAALAHYEKHKLNG